jgi:hypothetical protein
VFVLLASIRLVKLGCFFITIIAACAVSLPVYSVTVTNAVNVELINHKRTFYNVRKYTELLIQTCNSVIEPFGIKLNLGPSSNNEARSILPGASH